MRILLLGATGNLGRRLIPALLVHNHTLTLYVRSPSKLHSLISPSLLFKKKVILDRQIEGIVNVAGTQVRARKGEEFLLEKIAKGVTSVAVEVGRERGVVTRVWITSGIGIMKYPGTGKEIQDFMPQRFTIQHDRTRAVVEAIPMTELRWSLLAVAMMYPINPKQALFEPIKQIQPHDLLIGAGSPPGWKDPWLNWIPFIGPYVNVWRAVLMEYGTHYESVADFLAEDMEKGGDEWVGKRVALKDSGKKTV